MHAAEVLTAFRQRYPQAQIRGIAGPAMLKAGCEAIAGMNELNVMGIVDVLKSLPRIRKVRQRILDDMAAAPPDVAILVDFPGFHINLGRRLRAMGIPVLQYIAPKLWAWGSWRSGKLKCSQDALASILPFEPEWFARHDIAARYVGNPSAVACRQGWSREVFREKAGITGDGPVLAILPGSRPSELNHHVELLAEVWRELRKLHPELYAVVPLAPGVDQERLAPLLAQPGMHTIARMQQGFRIHADAAVAVSGTATLELALWDIPTLLVYRTAPFTVFVARCLVKIEHIGLANLLLGKTAMPELIQEQADTENILKHINLLLGNADVCRRQREDFAGLRLKLGDFEPAREVVDIAAALAAKKV